MYRVQLKHLAITIAIIIGIFVSIITYLGFLQASELDFLDFCFQSRTKEPPDERIAIVRVTEADIRHYRWPLSDLTLANAITKISLQSPVAIGLDIYRDLPVEPGHEELTRVFQSTPNLIGIEKAVGSELEKIPGPVALADESRVATVDVIPDTDGVLRRAMLYPLPSSAPQKESLSLKLALWYLKREGILPSSDSQGNLQLGTTTFPGFNSRDGGYNYADDRGYQIMLNYRTPINSFSTVTINEVLTGKDISFLRDKIVLIGNDAASINDFFYTPFSSSQVFPQRISGVEIQAHQISQILSSVLDNRNQVSYWWSSINYIWIFFWSGLGSLLLLYRPTKVVVKDTIRIIIYFVLSICILLFISYLSFTIYTFWIPIYSALTAFIIAAFLSLIYLYIWQLKHLLFSLEEAYESLNDYSEQLEEYTEFISLALKVGATGFLKWDLDLNKITLYYLNQSFFDESNFLIETSIDCFLKKVHPSYRHIFEEIPFLYFDRNVEEFCREFSYFDFKGEQKWALLNAKVTHSPTNKKSFLTGVIFRFDWQDKLNLVLHEQKQYLSLLTSNTINITFVLDLHFDIIDVLFSLETILGFDKHELVDTWFFMLVHPRWEEDIQMTFQKAINSPEQTFHVRAELYAKAGTIRLVVLRVVYYCNSSVNALAVHAYDTKALSVPN